MPGGLPIRRVRVYLGCCDVGMSEFLPQGLDIDAVLVPPCNINHTESMARLSRLFDRAPHSICFVDDSVDDPIQVLIHRSGCGRWED